MQISQGFKRYFINTSWLFIGKFLYSPLNLLTGILIARYLGPTDFGLLSYVTSFVGLFLGISTLGLDIIIVKDILNNEEKKEEILGTAFVLRVFCAFILLPLLLVCAILIKTDFYTTALMLIIALSMIFQSFYIIKLYFQAKVLSKYIVITQTLATIFISILKFGALLMKLPLIYFAGLTSLEFLITSIIYIFLYKKLDLSLLNWKFNGKLAVSLLKSSFPLILAGSLTTIYMRIDQIMIQNMLGSQQGGLYAVSVKLSEIWYFIPVLITDSLYPAIVNAKKMGADIFYSRQQDLYNLLAWQGIILATVVTFLSKPIVILMYGQNYANASTALVISVWSGIFVSLNLASSKSLVAENHTRIILLSSFVGAISNIALNLILIPGFGINGAAIATLFSYFLMTFSVILIKRTRCYALMMFRSMVFGLSDLINNLKQNSKQNIAPDY